MPSKFQLTRRALADLEEIAVYTANLWGEDQAIDYVQTLYDRFTWLVEHPLLGRERADINATYRSYKQGAHIIFYRSQETHIEIIGIVHQSRDVDLYFED